MNLGARRRAIYANERGGERDNAGRRLYNALLGGGHPAHPAHPAGTTGATGATTWFFDNDPRNFFPSRGATACIQVPTPRLHGEPPSTDEQKTQLAQLRREIGL